MTKASDLTAVIKAQLELIAPSNGYHTDLKGVFELRPAKDNQPTPFALFAWQDDASLKRGQRDALRSRNYVIQGVFDEPVGLADLDKFHYDVLRAMGYGAKVFENPISAELIGDSAEVEPAADGSSKTTITITLEARYTEAYA